jgi:outer membrane protein assembly factor BamB
MYRTSAIGDIPGGGHARFVGRVGALAVFLGVGVALSAPGSAHADAADNGSAKDSSSQSRAAHSNGPRKADSSPRATAGAGTGSAKSASRPRSSTGAPARKLPAPGDVTATTTRAVTGVVDAVSKTLTGTPPSLPAAPPSPAVLLAAVHRELVKASAASATVHVTAQPTAALVTDRVAALQVSATQWVGNLLPYTTAALSNALNMVVTYPKQVLLQPITATLFVAESVLKGVLTDFGVLPALPYADTGWVTLHGDPGNRKDQLGVTPAADYNRWTALHGAAVLAAPTILPNGNIVVTTGLAAGSSNLHVLDSQGNIVWESTPWNGQEGVDSGAVLNSAIIDRKGNIYISDGDQLWSFTQDGAVRWVTALPPGPAENPFAPGSREINPFITATLTNDGSVFGVTTFGQVVVVNSQTGELAAPIYQIPGPLAPPASQPAPPTMWTGGYMDPAIIDPVWQVAYGGIVRSANTPGVDARTGRIFVAASGEGGTTGALYAFDYIPATPFGPGGIKVAFVTEMGPGSGSSPTVSADGAQVYASDNDGVLYAFDTRTGKTLWQTQSHAEAASVAVDKTGNIYVLTRNNVMASFDSTGEHRWDADVSNLLAMMPVSPILGNPVAVGGGNPTVVNGAIVESVIYGYNATLQGRTIFVPVRAALVEFDPETGVGLRNITYTTEGTEGILNIAPNGNIYASIGAITTTSLAPIASILDSMLPTGYTVLTPGGGVNGFTPVTAT